MDLNVGTFAILQSSEAGEYVGAFMLPAGTAFFIQQFINVVKKLFPQLQRRFPRVPDEDVTLPLLSIVGGFGIVLLNAVATEMVFSKANIAKTIMQGAAAGFGPILSTEWQKSAHKVDEKIEVALSLPPESTRADVEAIVREQGKSEA